MKLKYLGTAAAEAIPGMFCNCRVCKNALAVRGKEIKTRSQAMIDGKLLIDFCPDTYLHIINYGLDLRWVHHCIITHSHMDHFLADDFWCRLEGMAHDIGDEVLNVYLTNAGYEKAKTILGGGFDSSRLKFHKIAPFEPFEIEDYRIIPLAANHDKSTDPVIYIIEKGEKTLLYANDTGIFPESTWEYLKGYGRVFDFMSLDCTGMLLKGWVNSHMGVRTGNGMTQRDERLCERAHPHSAYADKVRHFPLLAKSLEQVLDPVGRLFRGISDGIGGILGRTSHRVDCLGCGIGRPLRKFPCRTAENLSKPLDNIFLDL